jgi:hypothetical protein
MEDSCGRWRSVSLARIIGAFCRAIGAGGNLPPSRDAPGMVPAGAAVVGSFVGTSVGAFLGFRYAEQRQRDET